MSAPLAGHKRPSPLEPQVTFPEDAVQVWKAPRHNSTPSVTALTVYQPGESIQDRLLRQAATWAFDRSTEYVSNWLKRKRDERDVGTAPEKRVTTTTTSVPSRSYSAAPRKVTRTTVTKMAPKKYSRTVRRMAKKFAPKIKTNFKNRTYFGHSPSQTLRGAGEFKYYDIGPIFTTPITDTVQITHLDSIPMTDTVSGRNGQRFQPTKARIRMTLRSNTSTQVTNMYMALIWDYEPKKTLANAAEIMQSPLTVTGMPNRDNAGRFRVIKRWNFSFAGNFTNPATGLECAFIDEYIKLPTGLVAVCDRIDTSGVIGNRIEGALIMIAQSDVSAVGNAIVTSSTCRINFRE